MRYVLDAASMKNVDSYSINTLGIPSVVLMERAALSVTEAIESKVKGNIHTDIICVCGRGNNGWCSYRRWGDYWCTCCCD